MPRRPVRLLCGSIVLLSLLASAATAQAQGYPMFAPPPPPLEVAPPPPPGPPGVLVWRPGFWRWDGRGYVWTGGRYVRAHRGAAWIPGQWVERGHRWMWIPGHWG